MFARGAAAAVLVLGLLIAGCGEAAQQSGPTVTLSVTRDFGREVLEDHGEVELERGDTVLSLLKRHHEVELEPGFPHVVGSIDGVRHYIPSLPDSRSVEQARRHLHDEGRDPSGTLWMFVVNGVTADPPPAEFKLFPGDVVQADLRDYDASWTSVRSTVGGFPQPFTGGMHGDEILTRVRCVEVPRPCRTLRAELRQAGVEVGVPPPGVRKLPDTQLHEVVIVVGRWTAIRDLPIVETVPRGLGYSRVYPHFSADGRSLELRDWGMDPVRTEGAGSGFVASMKDLETRLVWVVTGVDDEGVQRAAEAVNPEDLHNAFAVAVSDRGVEKVPLEPPRFADRD